MKTRRKVARPPQRTGSPFLRGIVGLPEKIDPAKYPFSVRAFSRGIDLAFRSKVTFLVGENGSGKSTLLEAIAECCGFNPEGGNRDHHRAVFAERSPLAHSPILLSYPGAVLFSLDGDAIQEIEYRETQHFLITRDFLNAPERFFKHLFEAARDGDTDA